MAFEKGKSGNPSGKVPGTINKVTADVRETIKAALSGVDSDTLSKKLKELDGKDYIDAYTKLAEFVTPKLQRTAIAADNPDDGKLTITLNLGGPAKDAS
jgi:hypothetical protein